MTKGLVFFLYSFIFFWFYFLALWLTLFIFDYVPQKLSFSQIVKGRQIIMFIFSKAIEQTIVVVLENPKMLADLFELFHLQVCCHEADVFFFRSQEIAKKLVVFYGVDVPSFDWIFY